jgi:hypothetical protein
MKGFSLAWAPDVLLANVGHGTDHSVWHKFLCAFPSDRPEEALGVFTAFSQWTAMVVFEGVAAALALGMTVTTLAYVGNRAGRRDFVFFVLLLLGAGAVANDVTQIWSMRSPGAPQGFLSLLLSSLPPECIRVRHDVVWARLLAEPTGVALGVAMVATVSFAEHPNPEELGARARHLNRLLYVASVLFVAGIMMSRANFVWVLAHWDVSNDDLKKAIAGIVKAGVIQSGVGYTALMTVFFAPVRALLSWQIERAVPAGSRGKAREKWLKDHDLFVSWQDDARQILALLAPLVSAPVFEAITKI